MRVFLPRLLVVLGLFAAPVAAAAQPLPNCFAPQVCYPGCPFCHHAK
jgi:hypothetical protein